MAEPSPLADGRAVSDDKKLGVEDLNEARGPTRIEKAFGHLVPEGLNEKDRQKFIAGIAVAVYVQGMEPDALRQRIEQTRREVAKERGEQDPKIDRLAALRFSREIRGEAIERDPMRDVGDAEASRNYKNAVEYARSNEMGWTTESIRKATVDLLVEFDGDRTKAAQAFHDLVMSNQRVETGHKKDVSNEVERKDGSVYNIADNLEPNIDAPTPETELIARREPTRERETGPELQRIDRIAAAVLTDREYAGYRLMRENPEVAHLSRRETTLDGEQRDNTPGKLIAERLGIAPRTGRTIAHDVLDKLNGRRESTALEHGADKTAKVDQRMNKTTEQIVEAARKGRTPEQAEASRDRERIKARERAARLYEQKKARKAAEKNVGMEL